jgi:C4-dicarboxylate-specific signal transduction histidine kinase
LSAAGAEQPRRLAAVLVRCGLEGLEEQPDLAGQLGQEPVLSLLEHLGTLNASSEITLLSAGKIARIVRAMRYYAHAGQDALVETDLNESVDNTLVILQNRLKQIADVQTDFDASLPRVRCGPDISHVWTNVLNNACDAIEEHRQDGGLGRIEVSTRPQGDHVAVRIANDGGPIPADVLGRIFDPFFTTKPVGKGTGLGLSICAGILRRCGGSITARNEKPWVVFEVLLPTKTSGGASPAPESAGPQATRQPVQATASAPA